MLALNGGGANRRGEAARGRIDKMFGGSGATLTIVESPSRSGDVAASRRLAARLVFTLENREGDKAAACSEKSGVLRVIVSRAADGTRGSAFGAPTEDSESALKLPGVSDGGGLWVGRKAWIRRDSSTEIGVNDSDMATISRLAFNKSSAFWQKEKKREARKEHLFVYQSPHEDQQRDPSGDAKVLIVQDDASIPQNWFYN